MENKQIKINDNQAIPKIGLGTWQLEGQLCIDSVSMALDMGYRCVDTAQIYGNEEEVGAGIEKSSLPRDQMFLVSKVWRDNLSFDKVISSTEESLKKLKTDVIDLMLIHWPNDDFPLEDSLKAFDKLVEDGKINSYGFANFTIQHLQKAFEFKSDFVCNQVEDHPYLSQTKVLDWLQKNGKFLMAYSPLARGKVLEDEVIKKIANDTGCDPAQITLAWLMRKDPVMVIPKASSKEHLQSNLRSLEIVLSDQAIAEINHLQGKNERLINPDFAPIWD